MGGDGGDDNGDGDGGDKAIFLDDDDGEEDDCLDHLVEGMCPNDAVDLKFVLKNFQCVRSDATSRKPGIQPSV